jgi:hypothetical protein
VFSLELNEEVIVFYIDDGLGSDSEVPTYDIRESKPVGLHNRQDNTTAFIKKTIKTQIDGANISLVAPNEIALSLNISKKSNNKANQLRKDIKILSKELNGSFCNENLMIVYDYLEEIQKSIVFSYKAIESFCNTSIPDDYTYEKETKKGTIEVFKKEQIERWLPTSEKVSKILPMIFEVSPPKEASFWSDFKSLEKLRNEIIHSKTNNSSEVLSDLFTTKVNDFISSSTKILELFITSEPSNILFPLGFGRSIIPVTSHDDTSKLFKESK